MKKITALVLALMMLFSAAAFAEAALDVEEVYDGVWVPFVDDGFEMYLPSDWVQVEITDELLQSGIYFAAASAQDETRTVSVAWNPLDEMTDLAAMEAALVEQYPGAQVLTLGNVQAVAFASAETDALCFALPDLGEPGMYMFTFTPASGSDMQVLATLIMTSLRPLTAQ